MATYSNIRIKCWGVTFVEKCSKIDSSCFDSLQVYQSDFLAELKDKYEVSRKERDLRISAERVRRDHAGELSRRMEDNIEKRLREHLQITEVAVVEVGITPISPYEITV